MMDLDRIATETMERMHLLHQEVYRIIEKNVERARLEIGDCPYDPWFFTHYVRYFTCLDLDALPPSRIKIQRAKYAMSGIELLYDGTRVKIWKANEGELPMAGGSVHRKAFLSQLFTDEEMLASEPLLVRPTKLAVLWDVDSQLHLNQMDCVCPRDIENPWKASNHYFKRPIPHPASAITVSEKFTEEPIELEVELERKKVDSDGPLD